MKRAHLLCILLLLAVFGASCGSEATEDARGKNAKDATRPKVCSFDILGLKLGMSREEFLAKAKGEKFPNFGSSRIENDSAAAFLLYDSYGKIRFSKLQALVSKKQYGGNIYYIQYQTDVGGVEFRVFWRKFAKDLEKKYGPPSLSFTRDMDSSFASFEATYCACYGDSCDQLRVNDRFLVPISWGDKPVRRPVKGCHMVVECRRWQGSSALIRFYLFDGGNDYRAKQQYEKRMEEVSKKKAVKF